MHVTYGRERSETACRATADISLELGTPRAGRRSPLAAYIITGGNVAARGSWFASLHNRS
jgi:hypothetical protein